MKRFIHSADRNQGTLFPEHLEDFVTEDNPVRVIDVFVEQLDLGQLGFASVTPLLTGRPAYHPSVLLKLYLYGYLNWIQSSRRLERDSQRNLWGVAIFAKDFSSHPPRKISKYYATANTLVCPDNPLKTSLRAGFARFNPTQPKKCVETLLRNEKNP